MDIATTIKSIIENPAATALIGALAGGWFTLNATVRAHNLSRESTKSENLSATANSLSLIQVELQTAWNIYNLEYASELLEGEDGEPYLVTWPIGKDTFTIFNSMPQCLAEISPAVSSRIVEMYMRIKGLVAMIEENNKNVELARKAGLQKLDALMEIYVKNQVDFSTGISTPLDDFFEKYIYWEAKKTGMGEYADAIRLLTIDMRKKLSLIILELGEEIDCIKTKIRP